MHYEPMEEVNPGKGRIDLSMRNSHLYRSKVAYTLVFGNVPSTHFILFSYAPHRIYIEHVVIKITVALHLWQYCSYIIYSLHHLIIIDPHRNQKQETFSPFMLLSVLQYLFF